MANKLFFLLSFLVFTSAFILMTSEGSPPYGNNYRACAACKYQRRRCGKDCIFRLYFPANKHEEFENVRRVFGHERFKKMLENLLEDHRDEAAKAIIYEANARRRRPINGTLDYIRLLQNQIERTSFELRLVQHQLAILKSAAATATASFDPAAMASLRPAFTAATASFYPAGELSSSGYRASSSNLTNHLSGVAADGGSGGYFGGFVHETTETMPSEITDAQQHLPTSTDPSFRLLTATENANDVNNNENAIDFVDLLATSDKRHNEKG